MRAALLMSQLLMFVELDFLVPTTFLCVSILVKILFVLAFQTCMYMVGGDVQFLCVLSTFC